jgi:hypothetical protein
VAFLSAPGLTAAEPSACRFERRGGLKNVDIAAVGAEALRSPDEMVGPRRRRQ